MSGPKGPLQRSSWNSLIRWDLRGWDLRRQDRRWPALDVRMIRVDEILEFRVQEIHSELVLLHFRERLVSGPCVVGHPVDGGHDTRAVTAVYRMTDDGWTADKAFAEMKQYKFGMYFLHSEFKDFVYAYHPDVKRGPATVLATQIPAAQVPSN